MAKADFINVEDVYKIGYKAGYDDALKHATGDRKKAAWVKTNQTNINGDRLYFCTNCKKGDFHDETVPVMFCWNCGSNMVLPEMSVEEWEAAKDEVQR